MVVEETISYININGNEHPIDACSIDGKNDEYFQESGKLVNHISSSSTDDEYPSAKCLYDMIWGSGYVPEHDYSKDYLTFDIIEDGTVTWRKSSSGNAKKISYNLNDSGWTEITPTTSGVSINVNSGDVIKFKGTNTSYGTSYTYTRFGGTSKFNVSGNIMSLIDEDDFSELNTISQSYCFYNLFSYTNVFDCENLILPAMTLGSNCYNSMFYGCSQLKSAPQLPATTLGTYCYRDMFSYCIALVNAPELPATNLENGCYHSMFRGCTNLTNPPVLPATTLVQYCYSCMFYGCTKLMTTPILPATTLAQYCYDQMFANCSQLITAPVLPATSIVPNCYVNMFANCSQLINAPVLPATTLSTNCYQSMFNGCTSLTTAPDLPAEKLGNGCYQAMFENCTNLTIPPALPATTLASNCYRWMFHMCSKLTVSPVLPATKVALGCYVYMFQGCRRLNYITCYANYDLTNFNQYFQNWVDGVSSTGTFVGNEESTWLYSSSGIPDNWTTNTQIKEFNSSGLYGLYAKSIRHYDPNDFDIDWFINNPYVTNEYIYTGSTIAYGNGTYYVWERTDGSYDEVKYALTDTIDYDTLYSKSLEYDKNNLLVHPVKCFLNDDYRDYSDCRDQNIVTVKGYNNNTELYLYVDDFVDSDINSIITSQTGVPYYEYSQTFRYDGDTYYLWKCQSANVHEKYLLTDTINMSVLQSLSLVEDISNIDEDLNYLFLDESFAECDSGSGLSIIKAVEFGILSSNTLAIYVDSFVPNYNYNYTNWFNNPGQYGSCYYEYCQPFEYNDETYYIWKVKDDGYDNSKGEVTYILTDTIDYNELQSKSLKYSLSNLTTYPIVGWLDYDLNDAYIDPTKDYESNIIKVVKLNLVRPQSSNTLGMYIDDFVHDNIYASIENPKTTGSNPYKYVGDTISYNGDDLYVWKRLDKNDSNTKYALTDTIDYDTLDEKSLKYDLNNIYTYPIYAYLNKDGNEYDDGRTDNIISINRISGLGMWVDDNFEYGCEDGGYSDMEEYLDWYFENIEGYAGGDYYYYIEPFEYNNTTCYIWYSYTSGFYLITDTININTLQGYSIESNYSNVNVHPIMSFLFPDRSVYEDKDVLESSIVKVVNEGPGFIMYLDDFFECDYSIEDYIEDPESYGGAFNYYEYCEPFEYDDETYYIWINNEVGDDSQVKYILTDTINVQELELKSLENDLSNLFVYPIVAYLDYDLEETYLNTNKRDNIVKVFRI